MTEGESPDDCETAVHPAMDNRRRDEAPPFTEGGPEARGGIFGELMWTIRSCCISRLHSPPLPCMNCVVRMGRAPCGGAAAND